MCSIEPLYRLASNRVWRTYLGGRTLEEIAGNATPEDSHFPEDWIFSTTSARNAGRESEVNEGLSRVESGNGVVFLTELLEENPEAVLGREHVEHWGPCAGFLLKYLDSSIRLHMQCHPSVDFAKAHLGSNFGKTEGYTILGVRPGCEGYVYLGFQRAPSRETFRRAVVEQDLEALWSGFEKIPVHAGDCFYVPGGVPHAIGEGVFMIEMMEPTDYAVRVEFDRGGYVLPESARFMGRDVDFALSMFDFTSRSVEETRKAFFVEPQELPIQGNARRESLFDERTTFCFRSERIILASGGSASVSHTGMRVFIVTRGNGTIEADGCRLELRPYDRVLVPAQTREVVLSGEMELVIARPPAPSCYCHGQR